jgi:Virulence-associated protein E
MANVVICHPAPQALIDHCMHAARRSAVHDAHGTRDLADTIEMLKWMVERDLFTAYGDWCSAGMALKMEFGDAGLPAWRVTHDATVTAEVEIRKWSSFAVKPTGRVQTLNSLMSRAHAAGWSGTIRKSASVMFDGVASIATAAGAGLSGPPGPSNDTGGDGRSLMARGEQQTRIFLPILQDFLTATGDEPFRPSTTEYPTLPVECSSHGLYDTLQQCIARVLAMAESRTFKSTRVVDCLAVLYVVHQEVCDSVMRRIRTSGRTLPESKVKLAAAALSDKVERTFVPQDAWLLDARGYPESDNSDNVAILLSLVSAQVRRNNWLERIEIQGGLNVSGSEGIEWPHWTPIDDDVVACLRTRANRTKTRFRPAKEFFWESLIALAKANTVDPATDRLAELQSRWDGQARLATWLTAACGVPCDLYHQAVGKNVIGGMVRRIRRPGVKHDTMPVFYGPQGTGKSTMATILAPRPEWFTDSILLGDASKELVLSLAGKCVVEISEMGMRNSANANAIKAMVSRQFDEGRTAYARSISKRARRCVFIGTVNDSEPLSDPTGNRRFLPVRVDNYINLTWLRANIEQLVGEACALEAAGADFYLPQEVWTVAAEYQEAARSEVDMETMLSDWFAETPYTSLAYIHSADLAHLAKVSGWRTSNSTRGAFMKKMRFRSENPEIGGKRVRVWVRAPVDVPPAHISVEVRSLHGWRRRSQTAARDNLH